MMVRKQCNVFQLIQLLLKDIERTSEKVFAETKANSKKVAYTLYSEKRLLDGGTVLNSLE
jgi:hypothetical protein